MNSHKISLIDVLAPPVNPWLKGISRFKSKLPAGVRVVRFGDEDEDGFDLLVEAVAPSTPRPNNMPSRK